MYITLKSLKLVTEEVCMYVSELAMSSLKKIDGSGYDFWAISILSSTDNNTVYNWGYGPACGRKVDVTSAEEVELEDYEEVTKLQGGDSHSVALTAAGRVFLWGSNHEVYYRMFDRFSHICVNNILQMYISRKRGLVIAKVSFSAETNPLS